MTLLTVRCPLCPWRLSTLSLEVALITLEYHRDNECEGPA